MGGRAAASLCASFLSGQDRGPEGLLISAEGHASCFTTRPFLFPSEGRGGKGSRGSRGDGKPPRGASCLPSFLFPGLRSPLTSSERRPRLGLCGSSAPQPEPGLLAPALLRRLRPGWGGGSAARIGLGAHLSQRAAQPSRCLGHGSPRRRSACLGLVANPCCSETILLPLTPAQHSAPPSA